MTMSVVQHQDRNKGIGRGLSGIFRGFRTAQVLEGLEPGIFVDEDFIHPDAVVSNRLGGFHVAADSITNGTGYGGELIMTSAASAGAEAVIAGCNKAFPFTKILFDGTDWRSGFEVRLKLGALTDYAIIIGYVEIGVDPLTLLGASGVLTAPGSSKKMMGIYASNSVNSGKFQTFYVDSAGPTLKTTSRTLAVPATYFKAGMRFTPDVGVNGKLDFVVNGESIGSVSRNSEVAPPNPGAIYPFVVWQGNALEVTIDRFTFYSDLDSRA